MRHDIIVESYGVRLRPVTLEDAEFIVRLRNSPEAVGRIGDSRSDASSQREWLELYFNRPDDFYFIIETVSGKPVGTIGLYDFAGQHVEWGRWIILPRVPAALPSVMGIYALAFDRFRCNKVVGKVVSSNQPVLSFHRKFGMRQVGVEKGSRTICGTAVDMVVFELSSAEWPAIRVKNAILAPIAERQMISYERELPV